MGNSKSKSFRKSPSNKSIKSTTDYGNTSTNTSITTTTPISNDQTTSKKSSPRKPKTNALAKLFDKYVAIREELEEDEEEEEEDVGKIVAPGIIQFLQDLGVDPMDVIVLVIMWKLGAQEKFKLTKKEFIDGFNNYGMFSIQNIKEGLPKWRSEIESKTTPEFKKFYGFLFNYNKEQNQKSMVVDIAVPTWELVLKDRYKHINEWCDFIKNDFKKAISRDTWDLFLDFINQVGEDFENFEEDGAWPVAIDEFYEKMKEKGMTKKK